MNILVLTPYIPYPPGFGGAVRIYHLIRQLSRRHQVHLLSFREEIGSGNPKGLEPFCRTITLIPRRPGNKRLQQMASLLSPHSFQWGFNYSRPMQNALDRLVSEQSIDLILVEFSQMAGFRFPAGVPVVLDEHNVEFDLLERMAEREGGFLRRSFNRIEATKFRREELSAVRNAALTLVTSDRDAELLTSHSPDLKTVVITNGVDCDHFVRPDGPRQPESAVFVGATHYFPNEDGVLFFLREIHKKIKKTWPSYKFTIVGGNPPPTITRFRSDDTVITGYVDDVRPYMWGASLFVVPLRMGGGTRFKIVEAMAAGVPVVSTRLGAEGIAVTDGQELLMVDEPEAFAGAVGKVFSNPALADSLTSAGLEFVHRYFDWSVIGEKLDAALEKVSSK
ncbi:MAG: glycosyltransferase [Syntrophus sp. (in: bacteria)]